MINVIKLLIFVLAVLLTACQQEKEDLASYVAAVQAKQISDIDPIPVMKSYEKFTYSAAELRDPFVPTVVEVAAIEDEMPLEDNGIHPEEHRLKEALESYSLRIFDRWGEILFFSDDMKVGWDGTYKGTLVKTESYVWKIKFKDIRGIEGDMYGTVTVIR